MKKISSTCFAVMTAAVAFAAGVQRDPVAEGFMDWDGLSSKNFLYGRLIGPSDLRHKAVVYVVVDAAKFTNDNVPEYSLFCSLAPLPPAHMTQWETQELPRDKIVVLSVRNAPKTMDRKAFSEILRAPKNADEKARGAFTAWQSNMVPIYKDLTAVGEQEITTDKMPYVAVYGSGTEPLYKKENWTKAESKNVRDAVNKALKGLAAELEWKPPLGVAEPQFYKKVAADFAKGKPVQGILSQLKSGIKSKNPEQAKEAQIMFDAINQYKSDLLQRIQVEFSSAPARAYYDYQLLVKAFPAEKKSLQAIEAKMKTNKEIGALGKIFEKVMLWASDDFTCKNAGEAKKIVGELQKIKKTLDALATSKDSQIQGEAMLFQSQIENLIEIIPSKVAPK